MYTPAVAVLWARCALVSTPHWTPLHPPTLPQVRSHNEFFLGFSVSRPLVGKTVQRSGLRQLPNAFLVAIDRGATTLHAVSPDEVLEADDILWFAGEAWRPAPKAGGPPTAT